MLVSHFLAAFQNQGELAGSVNVSVGFRGCSALKFRRQERLAFELSVLAIYGWDGDNHQS